MAREAKSGKFAKPSEATAAKPARGLRSLIACHARSWDKVAARERERERAREGRRGERGRREIVVT